jgi:hypothetical protein
MERIDTERTIILVAGSNIVAEDRDRPLAYFLKTEIDKRGDGEAMRGIVVSDLLYLFSDKLQRCATIVVGGPKVNILAQMLYRDLPLVITVEQAMFIHMDRPGGRKHVVIYGWDYETTHQAVRLFVDSGQLDNFLANIWADEDDDEEGDGGEEDERGEEPEEHGADWKPGEE